jgi:hypothetical protein
MMFSCEQQFGVSIRGGILDGLPRGPRPRIGDRIDDLGSGGGGFKTSPARPPFIDERQMNRGF